MDREAWIKELTDWSNGAGNEDRLALSPTEAKEVASLLTPEEPDNANED